MHAYVKIILNIVIIECFETCNLAKSKDNLLLSEYLFFIDKFFDFGYLEYDTTQKLYKSYGKELFSDILIDFIEKARLNS